MIYDSRTNTPPFPSADDPANEQFTTAPGWSDSTQRQSDEQDESSTSDKVASKIEETVAGAQQKVSDVADGAGEKVGQVADQVQDKARQFTDGAHGMSDKGIDSAAAGLEQAANLIRQQGEGREGAIGNAATTTADTIETASAYLHEKDTDQLIADLEALVRKRPIESVLVAVGVGFVLSKILG